MLVKTRYDALEGYDVRLTVCARRVGAVPGRPLEFALFNWTGGGCTGYHYDLLVRRRGHLGEQGVAVVELNGDGDGAESGSMSGMGAVRKLRWEPFTPKVIDASLCQARLWNNGLGGQCDKEPEKGKQLCKRHARKHAHGLVTGDIPEAKFREFETEAKKRKQDVAGGTDAGLGAMGAAGEQCVEERGVVAEGKAEGQDADGRQERRMKRVREQSAAERKAEAAEGRAEAEKQGKSCDVESARRDADTAVGRAELVVDSLTEGELRGLVQRFVEDRRASDDRFGNTAAMSSSIEIHDDDVRQVRAAFNSDEQLGGELARLLRVVLQSGAELGREARRRHARIFRKMVHAHGLQGACTLGRR